VQDALAQHQAGLAFGVRAHRSFPFVQDLSYLCSRPPCYKVDHDFCGTVVLASIAIIIRMKGHFKLLRWGNVVDRTSFLLT
jgi:hypothetical protein